ncbi:MAG: hypothetical protein RIC55_18310 [Pirellulaceae bacterium]
MSKPTDLWSELRRALARRKRRPTDSTEELASLGAEALEERRLLAVTALAELLSTGSAAALVGEAELGGATQSAVDSLSSEEGDLAMLYDISAAGDHAPEIVSTEPALFLVVARNDARNVGTSVRSLQFFLSDADYEPATLPPIGIAVVGLDSADGRWQFTRDFGRSWKDVGHVSDDSALLLEPDARLRFVPGESAMQASFRYRGWDLSAAAAGERVAIAASEHPTAFSREVGEAVASVWTLAAPAPATIDALGQAELSYTVAGFEEGEYLVHIDWGDGSLEEVGEVSNGSYTATHTYRETAADGLTAPLPVVVEATELISGDDVPGSTRVATLAIPQGLEVSTATWDELVHQHDDSRIADDLGEMPQMPRQFAGLSGAAALALAAIVAGDKNWRQRVEEALESPESPQRVRRLRRRGRRK